MLNYVKIYLYERRKDGKYVISYNRALPVEKYFYVGEVDLAEEEPKVGAIMADWRHSPYTD